MSEYRELFLGAAVAAVSFFAAALGSMGKHLENAEHLTGLLVLRHLGLQLTLMPAAAALAGWLVATQHWHPLSMIPLGLAAGWGGFALGDVLYDIFIAGLDRFKKPKQ